MSDSSTTRPPRIWVLEPEVAERIAAGEVVERPASAVKELVENALDAGARRITVETEAGGKALLRVTDDGCGMTAEEARLAILRHATSKLRSADDLFNIHTLGFRGEALPSLAAVSELEILTRPDLDGLAPESQGAENGTRLIIHGGVVQSVEPAAAPVGTRVTARRLFFNVPVREKFLRSDVAEAGQITEWLQRLAMSRPDVSFRLTHDGREALLSPGSQDPLNAVVAVLGRGVARELLRVGNPAAPWGESAPSMGDADVVVRGFVGRPTLTRSNRSHQHFYVNGRSVRSSLFYRAMDDAFRSSMPSGRYPIAVLFIEVAPDAVDVNVHPAKTEVRFRYETEVGAGIARAVAEALRADAGLTAGSLLTDSSATGRANSVHEPTASPAILPGETPRLPFAEAALRPALGPERWAARPPGRAPTPPAPDPLPRQDEVERREDPFSEANPVAQGTVRYVAQTPEALALELPDTPIVETLPTPGIGELRLLGQAEDLFILAEAAETGELWIIDQHVAHERILFDRMTAPNARKVLPQPLLVPPTLEVSPAQALALEEHQELLGELGFELEAFGPGRFRLLGIPGHQLGVNYEQTFRDMADELAERSQGGAIRLRREEVATAAAGRSCKRAVKAGQKLSPGEMEQLLVELRSTRNPYTCPHGRPVFLAYNQATIHSLFGAESCE